MLERLKFVLGFIGAYHRARRAGASREDAKVTAARQMIGAHLMPDAADAPDRAEPSPRIAEFWTDPAPAFAAADDEAEGAWFGHGPFEITPPHIALLRQTRLSWEGAERGAPMLDAERPYGRSDLLVQLAEVFETDDTDALARRHVEMLFVLARTLKHGVLQPGHYALRNVGADDVHAAMQGYGGAEGLSDADLGFAADGSVLLTEEHLKLLRSIEIRWPSQWECDERLDGGGYPSATADPKRPYGDYTYIEIDMARILGCLPPPDGDAPAVFEPEPALAHHLQRLHWQMLGAMQAFVENACIAPGVYDL